MVHHRTREQIKLFDLFKLITLLILIVLLIPLWLFGPGASAPVSGDVSTAQTAADTPQIAQPESGATTVAETEATAPTTEAIAPATEEVATKGGEAEATMAEIEVVAPTLDLPGGSLLPGQVTLSGTGEPDSAVEVVVDGQRAGQATVGSDGKWGLSVGLPEVKEYQVSVQAVDASGNVLAASEVVRLTVVAVTEEAALAEEGTAEAGSQVTAPTKEATAEVTAPTLNLPSGSVTPGKVELTGAGAPGSEVEVVVDGQVVGKTTVDRDGKWSISVELPEAKDYEVSVQGVDASGKVIAVSEATVIALVAPVATEEASASVIPPTLNLPTNAVTVGQVELTGTGEPGREVEVVVDGQVVGKTTVDSEGKWSLLVELPEAKEYRVSVQVLDVNGTVLAESETVSLEVSAEQVALPAIPTPTEAGGQPYTVQAGDWLSKLALKFYGDMFAYPIIFEATNLKAEEDSSFATLFDPDLIEIGQKLWIPDETE